MFPSLFSSSRAKQALDSDSVISTEILMRYLWNSDEFMHWYDINDVRWNEERDLSSSIMTSLNFTSIPSIVLKSVAILSFMIGW